MIDERLEHRGRAAIANWKTEATAKYRYISEPIGIQTAGKELTVMKLRYCFTLEGDKIAPLEITA